MSDCKRIVTTAPLPGWKRFQHVRTGRTVDFNPGNPIHRDLLFWYEKNDDWQDISDCYRDEFEENQ